MKPNTCHFCGKPSDKVFCSADCKYKDKKGTWKNIRGATVLVVERKK